MYERARARRHHVDTADLRFSNVLSIVPSYSKCSRALTFENVCRPRMTCCQQFEICVIRSTARSMRERMRENERERERERCQTVPNAYTLNPNF
jgi:hypothetical protein